MEELKVLMLIYPLYGVPIAVGGVLAWGAARCLTGRFPRLRLCDWLLLVLPYLAWQLPEAVAPLGKTLDNLREGAMLGLLVAMLFGARLLLEAARPHKALWWSAGALAGSCATALAIWRFIPAQ